MRHRERAEQDPRDLHGAGRLLPELWLERGPVATRARAFGADPKGHQRASPQVSDVRLRQAVERPGAPMTLPIAIFLGIACALALLALVWGLCGAASQPVVVPPSWANLGERPPIPDFSDPLERLAALPTVEPERRVR